MKRTFLNLNLQVLPRLHDRQTGATLHIQAGAVSRRRSTFIPANAPATLAGQGTCFQEWDAQVGRDTIIIATGGGPAALAWFMDRNIPASN
jgi:threonine dehydratase